MKTVFSGIQPSGNLHIGNYIGALSQWVKIQNEREAIFCIVDLHAITVPQDPKTLKEKVLEIAALYLACGINPQKAHIFVQSENSDHTSLAWILNCITPFGQLERMTQFKEKSQKHEQNAGLFDYPVLMAADILLYQTDEVPVGEDQKQHVELTRDLAEKFNKKFGEVFKLPLPVIQKETARIMSLQDSTSKMSKSDTNQLATIYLLDTEEQIREKIKKAVTDSGSKISKDEGSAAISNLLAIYASFKNQSLADSLNELDGKMYSEFKALLADVLVQRLSEIQKKYQEIRSDEATLRKVLDEGREYAVGKSSETLAKVKELVGLI
ncbi:MAG TPA: tryptophan--tRNA ligase [Patescibacteria group bacterium]|jgi:tryptophanyl-tRNA synthetase|nr:tryptophan--tRNA ligase [Patescibacteria group bacterium]